MNPGASPRKRSSPIWCWKLPSPAAASASWRSTAGLRCPRSGFGAAASSRSSRWTAQKTTNCCAPAVSFPVWILRCWSGAWEFAPGNKHAVPSGRLSPSPNKGTRGSQAKGWGHKYEFFSSPRHAFLLNSRRKNVKRAKIREDSPMKLNRSHFAATAQLTFCAFILLVSLWPLPLAAAPGDEHWDPQFGWPGPGGNNYAITTHNGRIYASGLSSSTIVALEVWDGA